MGRSLSRCSYQDQSSRRQSSRYTELELRTGNKTTCCAAAVEAGRAAAVYGRWPRCCRLIDTFPPTSVGTRPPVATQNPRTALLLLLLLPVDSVL